MFYYNYRRWSDEMFIFDKKYTYMHIYILLSSFWLSILLDQIFLFCLFWICLRFLRHKQGSNLSMDAYHMPLPANIVAWQNKSRDGARGMRSNIEMQRIPKQNYDQDRFVVRQSRESILCQQSQTFHRLLIQVDLIKRGAWKCKSWQNDLPTDRPTDRPTDGQEGSYGSYTSQIE